MHANIHNTGVAFDSCEFTPDTQLKRKQKSHWRKKTKEEAAVQDSLSAETNGPKCCKHGIKQPSRRNKAEMKKGSRRKKKKRVVAVLESLTTGNNRSKCGIRRIVQPRQGNKVKTKKRRPSIMHQAKLSKEKMPQHWRHVWLASQNEQYQTRGDKMEAQGKFDGWSQLHVVKTGTWLYKGKAKKWKNKPKKRHKKRKTNKGFTTSTKRMTTKYLKK